MTSPASEDVKELVFVNNAARAAYEALPEEVKEMADAAVAILQNGGTLRPREHEDLKGKALSGVSEIKLPYDGDTYRTYQIATYDEVIFILDAGMKKSPRKSAIPKEQIERLEARAKKAKQAYKDNEELFKERYQERRANRGEPAPPSSGTRR